MLIICNVSGFLTNGMLFAGGRVICLAYNNNINKLL